MRKWNAVLRIDSTHSRESHAGSICRQRRAKTIGLRFDASSREKQKLLDPPSKSENNSAENYVLIPGKSIRGNPKLAPDVAPQRVRHHVLHVLYRLGKCKKKVVPHDILYLMYLLLKKIDQVAPHRFMSNGSVFSRTKRVFVLKCSICSSQLDL